MNAFSNPLQQLNNIEAEQALLGCLVVDPRELRKLALRAEHFYDPVHGAIFQEISDRVDAGVLVDAITLKPFFEGHEGIDQVGGLEYLARLLESACSNLNASDYATLLKDLAMRRALHSYGSDVQGAAIEGQGALSAAQAGLSEVLCSQNGAARLTSARDAAKSALEVLEDYVNGDIKPGLSTGIPSLDKQVCSMHAEELIVIAGRPAMGKTSLACNIAFNAAEQCPSVLLFSKEMSKRQLAYRAVSRSGKKSGRFRIPYRDMLEANITDLDVQTIRDEFKNIPSNLVISDSASMSVADIREACYQHSGTVGLIVIDYLQILTRPDFRGRNDASVLGEMTSSLKALAREFSCPVILLSQLSRAVENRDDKTPMLSDLRESGSIEQDADKVWFVYRPHYYMKKTKPRGMDQIDWESELAACKYQMQVIAAKTRNGPTGTVKLICKLAYDLIEEMIS